MRSRTCIKICLAVLLPWSVCLPADSAAAAVPAKKPDTVSAFISMAGECRYPAAVSEGNNIYLAWVVTEGVTASIYFRRSANEGKEWTSSRKISNDKGDCYPPAIAVNSGLLHAAWIDYGETVDGELYYTRSLDGGDTWEKNRILITNANSSRYPLLSCKDKNVYLIWQDVENKVYFKASYDKGLTWENQTCLGKVGKHSCYCYPPAISCNGNDLVVVWSDFSDDKRGLSLGVNGLTLLKSGDKMVSSVVCRTSADNGRTWGTAQVLSAVPLSKETREEIDNPILVSDGPQCCLFWLDRRNILLGEIFYARFDPKSVKFPIAGKNVYPIDKRSPKRPSVAFDKDRHLHFTWASYLGGESVICYGEIDQAGTALRPKKDLTLSAGTYRNPVITRTASGAMQVFWFDAPNEKSLWSRIFLKTSRDNGETWEDWCPQKKEL